MKQENLSGAATYTAPELTCAEISVEKGFAQSGGENFDSMSLDATDYDGDGVTL